MYVHLECERNARTRDLQTHAADHLEYRRRERHAEADVSGGRRAPPPPPPGGATCRAAQRLPRRALPGDQGPRSGVHRPGSVADTSQSTLAPPPPCWKRGKKRVSFNGIFVDSRTAAAAPSVCRFDRLSVCPSVCRSDRLSVCPSVRLSAALTVCPSVRPFLESFDGEFLKTYSSFSTRDLAKLTPRDAPPSEAAKQCAKMFGELHL